MPPLDAADHLIDHLFSVGPTTAGEPITFQEIAAWSELTGYGLDGWEADTLRRLSAAYASELYLSNEDPKRLAPFRQPEAEPPKLSREDLVASIRAAFGMGEDDELEVAED